MSNEHNTMQRTMADEVVEQHVYNHYDERPPEADFEVGETTRGATSKIELKHITLANMTAAIELYEAIRAVVDGKTELESKEEENKDED